MKHSFVILIFTTLLMALAAILRAIADEPKEDPDGQSPVPRITARAVEKLAYGGGTDQEIADRFQVDVAFLRRKYFGVLRVARALRKLHIRSLQFDLAKKLNASMLIWMGRNDLGQSTQVQEPDDEMPGVIE